MLEVIRITTLILAIISLAFSVSGFQMNVRGWRRALDRNRDLLSEILKLKMENESLREKLKEKKDDL